jgi:hypothetical protein
MFDRNLVHPSHSEITALGGFLYATGNVVIAVTNTTIEGHASRVSDPGGGAISLGGNASLSLSTCTISNYYALLNGAGILMQDNSSVSASHCTFRNLTTMEQGGGLNLESYCSGCSVTLVGSQFLNTSAGDGGGVMVNSGNVILRDTIFDNCQAEHNGGALVVRFHARVQMARCKLRGCRAAEYGGGVVAGGNSQVQMAECSLSNCATTLWPRGGGALFVGENARLQMQSCLLKSNHALGAGGGVFVEGSAQLDATKCIFTLNSCLNEGGGLYCRGNASVRLQSCVLSGNVAEGGGGLCVSGNASMVMPQTIVTGNQARKLGGGVELESDHFEMEQVRAAAHGNRAGAGAPDVFVPPTTLLITNSSSVERFVSRLNSDQGLVDVTLRLTGAKGIPSEGVPIVAFVDADAGDMMPVALAKAVSGAQGVARLQVKLRKPPGDREG